MHSEDGHGVAQPKKAWRKPEVRRIVAGSAENGGNATTNGDSQSQGAKS